jgi:hypothetical protein
MEFIETMEMTLALLTGFSGLIGTAISTYFAIRAWVKSVSGKNAQEIWGLIMDVADKAMEEAEKTMLSGADKKNMALNMIQASAETAGLDITPFMQQLNTYIDQTIAFVNKMSKR